MIKKFLSALTVASLLVAPLSTAFVSAATADAKTQAYDWSKAKVGAGGYIPGIIVNPTEQGLMYARTDMGGAYRWDANTNSWVQLLDGVSYNNWNMAGVEAIATDPVETNRLYIMTGMYNNDWVGTTGSTTTVLLRSTDYGKTFQKTVLPFKSGGNMPGRDFGERLMVDPNNNKILYMGTRGDDLNKGKGNGLWKSTDYGVTWNKVASFPDEGQFKDYYGNAIGIGWIVFDKASSQDGEETKTIYVGVADNDGNNIYKSTDAGKTWKAVAGQPTGMFAHSAVLAKNGVMYVTYNSELGPFGGGKGDIYKYDTNTGVWTKISPADPVGWKADGIPFGGVAVDPNNPDIVMATTQNLWWPDEMIYRSTDAGKTWKQLWKLDYGKPGSMDKKYTFDYSDTPWLDFGDKTGGAKVGWMLGDLEVDPFNSDKIMWASGASLYGTANISALDNDGTVAISTYAKGIEETSVLDLISPQSGANLLSAMGDDGGFRHEDLTKAPEMIVNPKIGTSTDIDYAESNPNIVIRVGNCDGNSKKNEARMGVSTDNGVTWKPANNCWTALTKEEMDAKKEDATNGNSAAISADGKTIVWSPDGTSYSGEVRQVSYSTDLGQTWKTSTGLPAAARVYSDRVNSSKFYAYKDGKFYVSTDGGATFTCTVETGLPKSIQSSFKATPGIEGDIWIGTGKDNDPKHSDYPAGLWHSTDSGKTFTKVTSIDAASSIGFGKAAPGKEYVALYTNGIVNGENGIFRSDDAGATWVKISDVDHQYGNATACITGDMRVYGRVYVGTNGFGIAVGNIGKDNGFTDVASVSTDTQSAIDFMFNKGFISGNGKKEFSPEANITKAQFIKMLIGTLEYKANSNDDSWYVSSYEDVDDEAWYSDAIGEAQELGILDGEGKFEPNKAITAEEVAAIMQKAAEVTGRTDDKELNSVVTNTIVSGKLTKASIVTMFYNIYNIIHSL